MQTIISTSIIFLCFNFLTLIPLYQSRFLFHRCINGNYTSNSTYQTNLESVLSSLVPATTTTTAYGFFNRSAGQPPDTVNAIALCRGDADLDICRSCINDANASARDLCPNRKGTMVWYDDCMLRYSDDAILRNLDSSNGGFIWTTDNIPNPDELYQAIRPMMDRLIDDAAGGDSVRKFASGNTLGPGFTRIYALMQCTPDLSENQCYDCLQTATTRIPNCCNASLDVRVLFPSCNVRYANSRFFNATVVFPPPPVEALPLSPPPSSPPPSGKNSNTTIIVIAVVVTISLVILLSIFIFVFIRRRRRRRKSQGRPLAVSVHEHGDIDEISTAKSLKYSFAIVKSATNNFSDDNKLGHGGFGVVYKGKLQNGKEIAVKRLASDSGQGEEEFMNEVLLLARLQHRNLVRLLGFSLEGSERLLMYEFVQNSSLDSFIFDPTNRATLDWERRYKIIGGIAKGLLYLHEDSRLKIIHRDMKASNVLLDDQMVPKIADFGMARLFTPEETQANTCRVVGTYGYMAPEYALHGQFSVKSDVFSFGVLLLEIVTGHQNHSFQNGVVTEDLLSRTWKSWRDGTTSNLSDPTLKDGSDSIRDMVRCIHIGLLCVQEEASDRPTMGSVVLMLSSSSLSLAVPSEPAFYLHTTNNPEKPLLTKYNSRNRQSNHFDL